VKAFSTFDLMKKKQSKTTMLWDIHNTSQRLANVKQTWISVRRVIIIAPKGNILRLYQIISNKKYIGYQPTI